MDDDTGGNGGTEGVSADAESKETATTLVGAVSSLSSRFFSGSNIVLTQRSTAYGDGNFFIISFFNKTGSSFQFSFQLSIQEKAARENE